MLATSAPIKERFIEIPPLSVTDAQYSACGDGPERVLGSAPRTATGNCAAKFSRFFGSLRQLVTPAGTA